jgi:hypothetical protein
MEAKISSLVICFGIRSLTCLLISSFSALSLLAVHQFLQNRIEDRLRNTQRLRILHVHEMADVHHHIGKDLDLAVNSLNPYIREPPEFWISCLS